jgi:hypothetical protein
VVGVKLGRYWHNAIPRNVKPATVVTFDVEVAVVKSQEAYDLALD